MEESEHTFTIGALARRIGLSVRTIRFLLRRRGGPRVARTPGGYRHPLPP